MQTAHLRVVFSLAWVAVLGCIADDRPGADERDDGTTEVEVFEVRLDIEVGPEVAPEIGEVADVTEVATGCGLPENTGMACDDDNACTSDDTCQGGHCVGATIDCAALDPQCWEASAGACDPTRGCPGRAVAEDVRCDDGDGPAAGACVDGWQIPSDTCNGDGRCVDRRARLPSGIHPIAGEWFAYVQSGTLDGASNGLRLMLTLGQDGDVAVNSAKSEATGWSQAMLASSGTTFCASADAGVTWTLGGEHFVGLPDPTRSVMVLTDLERRAVGLAVRPSGTPSVVDGRYRVVYTTQQLGVPVTYTGHVDFSDGCLIGVGTIEAPIGAPVFDVVATEDSCLVAVGGHVELEAGLRLPGSSTSTRQWFYGAIAAGGDLLVLPKGMLEFTDFGMLVLVRERDSGTPPSLSGDWGFALQRNGYREPTDDRPTLVFEHGIVQLGADFTAIAGEVFVGQNPGASAIVGGWWFVDERARYAQRASLGGDLVHLGGRVATGDGLIVGTVVAPPVADTGTPQALGPVPREGSLFFATRTAPLF